MHLIVHGHFYQPPREDPWTGRVPLQEEAAPYHDWNARVSAECYAPNARARVLDPQGRIESIVDNYEWMSFDFGPTLLHWLQAERPELYATILASDARSRARFGGHGGAIAQAYNHMILPLADDHDLRTQTLWGLADFERRFGRKSESIWLPETAVDARTIGLLVAMGIRYLVLAPTQAKRARPVEGGEWTDVQPGKIETRVPYRVRLGDGSIDVFFYDGPLSHAVSFEHLLRSGPELADRIAAAGKGGPKDGFVQIATDGEVYGHHQKFGDMCLADLITRQAGLRGLEWTNHGSYLDRHPPRHEVELDFGPNGQGSSWSCAHGIERWRSDCGCATGGEPGWKQAWRAPLRAALEDLRDHLREVFLDRAGPLLVDPWAARDAFIQVVLDRGRLQSFLDGVARRPLDASERRMLARLLESQHQAMLMFTSCAWFFADLAGIEVRQNLGYAARAIDLAQEYATMDLEAPLLERLAEAKSNVAAKGNGADLWRRAIHPMRRDRLALAIEVAALARAGEEAPERAFPAFAITIEGGSAWNVQIEDRVSGESSHVRVEERPGTGKEILQLAGTEKAPEASPRNAVKALGDLPEETRMRLARTLIEERLEEGARDLLARTRRHGALREGVTVEMLEDLTEDRIVNLLQASRRVRTEEVVQASDLLRLAAAAGLKIQRARIEETVYALIGRRPAASETPSGGNEEQLRIDPEALIHLAELTYLRVRAPEEASAPGRTA